MSATLHIPLLAGGEDHAFPTIHLRTTTYISLCELLVGCLLTIRGYQPVFLANDFTSYSFATACADTFILLTLKVVFLLASLASIPRLEQKEEGELISACRTHTRSIHGCILVVSAYCMAKIVTAALPHDVDPSRCFWALQLITFFASTIEILMASRYSAAVAT